MAYTRTLLALSVAWTLLGAETARAGELYVRAMGDVKAPMRLADRMSERTVRRQTVLRVVGREGARLRVQDNVGLFWVDQVYTDYLLRRPGDAGRRSPYLRPSEIPAWERPFVPPAHRFLTQAVFYPQARARWEAEGSKERRKAYAEWLMGRRVCLVVRVKEVVGSGPRYRMTLHGVERNEIPIAPSYARIARPNTRLIALGTMVAFGEVAGAGGPRTAVGRSFRRDGYASVRDVTFYLAEPINGQYAAVGREQEITVNPSVR